MGISKELQEVMAAIERLNPEWQADLSIPLDPWYKKITFLKDTEVGIYKGGIIIKCHGGIAVIQVTLSSETGIMTLFSKECCGSSDEYRYLECYIKNNQAYQRRKEAEQEARDRFLSRKAQRR